MKTRVAIYLLLLLLIPACASPRKTPRLILIYTSRRALEDFCHTQAIDPHRYRLGGDIVVFVGDHEPVTTLYMCPASEYTRQELDSFRPANCRPGMPGRNDPILKNLPASGLNVSTHQGDNTRKKRPGKPSAAQ
ncbi:MAG TPA: hypothetical protein VHY22_08570 [Chthoniobacteraceae bacterium]|nr:hypothetical protein [Chthoniobacteraceae bacterium]